MAAEDKTPEEEAREILRKKIMAYRRVFNTAEGKEVLTDILGLLKFHGRLESPEDVALHNASLQIMEYCGVWFMDNAFRITDELMKLSPLNEE